MEVTREVAEVAKKVMKKLKEEIEKKKALEDEFRQCSKEEAVTMADSVETLGVDLRTRVNNFGAKEKARRNKCKVRFSLIKKNKASQRNYHGELKT